MVGRNGKIVNGKHGVLKSTSSTAAESAAKMAMSSEARPSKTRQLPTYVG